MNYSYIDSYELDSEIADDLQLICPENLMWPYIRYFERDELSNKWFTSIILLCVNNGFIPHFTFDL
jgi:hypothetical protein